MKHRSQIFYSRARRRWSHSSSPPTSSISPAFPATLHRKLEIGCGGIIRGQISENSSPMNRKRNTCIFLRACIHVYSSFQFNSTSIFLAQLFLILILLCMALCLIYFLLCKVHRLSLIVCMQFITLYSHMLTFRCVNIFYFLII